MRCLRLLGDRAVTRGRQGAVRYEHGVFREPFARPERELGAEMVDDSVGH